MSATPAASSSSRVVVLKSLAEYEAYRAKATAAGSPLVLLFTAAWHQQPCQQMVTVCETLAKQFNNTLFAQLDAEEVSDVTEQFDTVESVPSTVLIKNGAVVGNVNGANAVELTSLVTQHSRAEASAAVASTASTAAAPASTESKEDLNARLSKLVRASPVMAFIKGTVEAPRCGFTKQLLAQLKETGVDFGTFDILSDSAVREGLKAFSNWPTYPQVYVEGELIGGLDVVKELIASGEFQGMIPAGHLKKNAEEALNERLKALIGQNRVMLFMKGTPDAPQCGFSNKAVAMLKSAGCEDFGSFNIFSDQEVREGLKAYSNWPTYPQLYVDNELVGGLDVMQELNDNGELKDMLNAPPPLEAK